METVITGHDYVKMLESYSSILEKTNQQLSLWYNPYGIMIGILTIIIALIAIIVSIILVYNSHQQRKRQKEFFDEQERLIKEKQERDEKINKEIYENSKNQFDQLIKTQQEKLKSADEENKKQIQKEIESLKRQSATIGIYKDPAKVFFDNSMVSPVYFSRKSMICSSCGINFEYEDDSNNSFSQSYSTIMYANKMVHCTHCGAINFPQ